jgi:broad specificity phosphatase PhoE
MTRLLLVRHGETDWNREHRWQGHAGPGLNALGVRQASAAAELLAGSAPAAVYTSDLQRAAETAAVIGRRLGLDPTADARLREVDVGSWSGRTRAELAASDPQAFRRWAEGGNDGYPRGETFVDLDRRATAAVHEIVDGHPNQVVVVVCHGGTIRAVVGAALGLPIRTRGRLATGPNGSISMLETRRVGLAVAAYNESGHLPPEKLD